MIKRLRPFLMPILVFCVGIVLAQDDVCPALVTDALAQVEEFCTDAERNEACYGNVALTAEAQPEVSDFEFEQAGDIVSVADILTIRLSEMDEENNVWGVALLRLQADIPDTLPGQNVTFLLFGDVEMTSTATEDQTPMQSFILKTGLGDSLCTEAPDSGLLVQTPDGVEEVTFSVNGVDVGVGSTVLFQADPGNEMTVSTVEGNALMTYEDELYPVVAGTQLRVPVDENLRPSGPPPLPQAYRERDIAGLPVDRLERPVAPQPPMDDDNLERLHNTLNQGQPPCGEAPYPPCERFNDKPPVAPSTRYNPEPPPERFPDLGDGRLNRDGNVRLPGGEQCAPPNADTPENTPACDDMPLPDTVRIDPLRPPRTDFDLVPVPSDPPPGADRQPLPVPTDDFDLVPVPSIQPPVNPPDNRDDERPRATRIIPPMRPTRSVQLTPRPPVINGIIAPDSIRITPLFTPGAIIMPPVNIVITPRPSNSEQPPRPPGR